jgi:uncharacterized protein YrrD
MSSTIEFVASAPPLGAAGKLYGRIVTGSDGEILGSISDLLLDVAAGRVAYALVARGGFMGLGERLFVIPWDKLELGADQQFISHETRETLEALALPDPAADPPADG